MHKDHRIYFDGFALVHAHQSGVARVAIDTVQALITEGYPVTIIVPRGTKDLVPTFSGPVGIAAIALPRKVFEGLLRLKLMPPIDWFYGSGMYIFPNFRNWPLWSSRSFTYVHDVTFLRYPEYVPTKNRRYLTKYIRHWISRTDKVITVSEHAKSEIFDLLHYPKELTEVVYNGIDTQRLRPQSEEVIRAVKAKYSLRDGYILFVGNIEPRKNITALVAAYKKLPKIVRGKYELVLLGSDGWLNERIEAEIQQAIEEGFSIRRLKGVGNDDLPAIYSGARLLVHPAIYEGFGLTPLEAMACGTPVAVANTSSLPEVVGEAGLTFSPIDIADMSAVIHRGLTDDALRAKLMRNSIRVVRSFDYSKKLHPILPQVMAQFEIGLHKHPLRLRLKRIYDSVDRRIRITLGDVEFTPYIINDSFNDKESLRKQIIKDYNSEQPNLIQSFGLKVYLKARRAIGGSVRFALHNARKVLK